MKGHGEKRSRKTEAFIAALLTLPTVEAAAKAAGIGTVTAWKWMKDPAFSGQYRRARQEAFQQTCKDLQQAGPQAVKALLEVVNDPGSGPSPRVSAARAVIELGLKAVDLDEILRRVEALETAKDEGAKPK